MSAATLNCPSCGAAADPHAPSCLYCRATLALAACPSCFAMMFTGARHCSHCGAGVHEHTAASAPASELRCPRCSGRPALAPRRLGELSVHQCPTCTGVFVGHASLERVVTQRDQAAVLARDLGEATHTKAPFADVVAYLPCAECATLMARNNYGRRSGVVVDVCKVHGVWFDPDELRRVAAFVAAGGLDEARKREIADLEQQIASKRRALNDLPRAHYQDPTLTYGGVRELLAVVWRLLD